MVGQRQIDSTHRADIDLCTAVPARPCPLARDIQRDRMGGAGKLCQHAVRSTTGMRVDIEPVAIGLGIELQREPIAALDLSREIDQRPAGMNVDMAVDLPGPLNAGDGAGDGQPLDAEIADLDIEARQDRPCLAGADRRGQLDQSRPRDDQPLDDEPVAQPGKGPPVELGFGGDEHQSLGIIDADIDELSLGEERAIDPSDAVAQPVRGPERRNPVRYPAMPHVGIEQRHRGHRQRENTEDHPRHPAQPAATRLCRGRGGYRLGLAQNA